MFICLMLRLYCAATFRLSPVEPGGCFCNRNVNQTLIAAANACCGTHQDGCNASVALQRICTKASVLHFPPRHNYRIGGVTAVYHDSSRVVETERRTTVPQKRTHHFDSRNGNAQQKAWYQRRCGKVPELGMPLSSCCISSESSGTQQKQGYGEPDPTPFNTALRVMARRRATFGRGVLATGA